METYDIPEYNSLDSMEGIERPLEGLYCSWEVIQKCDLGCDFCYALNEELDADGNPKFV